MASPFQTPQNERSFSSLIDDVISITGKPQSLISIVSYANATIRECQAFGLIARDLVEDELDIPDDFIENTAFIWTRPQWFRQLRTTKYPWLSTNPFSYRGDVFPEFIEPGRKQRDKRYYFYAANNYFAFKGCVPGQTIDVAYYAWARPLLYYAQFGVSTATFPGGPYTIRPAYFDTELNIWQYLNAAGTAYENTTGDPTVDEALQEISTNWIIAEWRDMVLSGTMAKVFARATDPRATTEFAQYKQTQKLFSVANGLAATGF